MAHANRFVVAKRNAAGANDILVERNDVGIIKHDSGGDNSIFFIRSGLQVSLDRDDFKTFSINKVGDAFPKKICNVCHKLLNTSEFAKNQNGKNNRTVRRPSCRNCREQLEGVDIEPKEKRKWLKSKPSNEPFKCPICLKRTIAGITSKVVLEHDHRTGAVRGWVCDSCNTGIGRFKDNKELLKRAIKFIR